MWHFDIKQQDLKSWTPFSQIWIIFTHLKLWLADAIHNFEWVKIQIEYFGGWRVITKYMLSVSQCSVIQFKTRILRFCTSLRFIYVR